MVDAAQSVALTNAINILAAAITSLLLLLLKLELRFTIHLFLLVYLTYPLVVVCRSLDHVWNGSMEDFA